MGHGYMKWIDLFDSQCCLCCLIAIVQLIWDIIFSDTDVKILSFICAINLPQPNVVIQNHAKWEISL